MYVLGLNIGVHDSSAALLRDGELRWLVEQERLSRRKHAFAQSPADAARACLAAESITLESVEAVAIGWDFGRSPLAGHPRFTDEAVRKSVFPGVAQADMPPVRWVPHHLAHAASAYYSAGGRDACVIVADGAGETEATSIWRGRDGRLELCREWPIAQSLGFFYAVAAEWAGLGMHWGAGKLMGLAAYGRPQPGLPLRRRDAGYEVAIAADALAARPAPGRARGRPSLLGFDPAYTAAVKAAFGGFFPYAERKGEDAIAYADFAATVQRGLEEAMLGVAEDARSRAGSQTLLLAGGVAMNCSMVGRLARHAGYARLYVPPVPTDAGVSLGAALVVADEHAREHGTAFRPARISHAYWSVGLTAEDAAGAASRAGLAARPLPTGILAERLAGALAAGRIAAWARGRGEIGQRALGARSLLADPRDRRSWERLNVIKGREMWRPVAPSVLSEYAGEVMAGPPGEAARFMLEAGQVAPAARTRVPAVTHVDGSARPQLVERDTNPGYWTLIDQFRRRTGVPAVVNTSFNLAGEPIVSSAADAVTTFLAAKEIDLLVLDNLLVARSEAEISDVTGER